MSVTFRVRPWPPLVLGLTTVLVACSSSEPALPSSATPEAVYELLTGPDGATTLRDISTYDWSDDGAKAAEYFAWVGPDATSPDAATATRAGESAHALAAFLAENQSELTSMSPKLAAAYGTALTPFQGAMVGDDDGIRGFGQLGDPGDLSLARSVFEVIATDANAGEEFVASAYHRARAIAANAAKEGCEDRAVAGSVGPAAVRAAAELSGLAASAIEPSNDRPQSVDEISYAMAAACLSVVKGPPAGRIVDYVENGALISPDDVFTRDQSLETYYQSLRDYLGSQGLSTSGFYDSYDEGKGE